MLVLSAQYFDSRTGVNAFGIPATVGHGSSLLSTSIEVVSNQGAHIHDVGGRYVGHTHQIPCSNVLAYNSLENFCTQPVL